MESDKVLHLIMKKLKEYKANPMRSTLHEKARQKNLMKMFCIYSSLKKKERAKEREREQKYTEDSITQSATADLDIQMEENNLAPNFQNVPIDSLSDNRVNIVNEFDSMHKKEQTVSRDIHPRNHCGTDFENTNSLPSTSTIINTNEQIVINENSEEELEEDIEEYNQEENIAVEGFLLQLGEGLRRLPYKQRSKLEIEFLARLFEVEDHLGLLDD